MHRLAWFYVHGRWPTADIDHINGNRDDNRLCNLREATRQQNIQNSKRRSDNRSGIKGVCWVESRGYWLASVKTPDGSLLKRTFDCKDKAAAFYRETATREFKEFARTE